MPNERLVDHLKRQLGFLERSCRAYDDGFKDEGIRVATVLRVLFHDTPRQVSLLSRMGAGQVHLLDTAAPPEPISSRTRLFIGMGRYTLTSNGTELFSPNLGDVPDARYEPFLDWWTQCIFVREDIRLTRRSTVITAADKDGGAHVDPTVTPEYEHLASDGAAGWFQYRQDNAVALEATTNAHLVCLRQIGYEVANSPELTALSE